MVRVLAPTRCCLTESFFISGSLFSLDYLVEAIKATPAYRSVDVVGLRIRLDRNRGRVSSKY